MGFLDGLKVEDVSVGYKIFGGGDAKEAAKLQAESAGQALALQDKMFDTLRSDAAPVRAIRDQTLGRLTDLYGLDDGTPDYSQFYESPDYNFRLNSGFDKIQDSAAAGGKLRSGQTLRGLDDYRQNTAASEFGSYYNRLANLAGFGQTGVDATNSALTQSTNAQSSILQDLGNAQASGIIGASNSNKQLASSALGALGQYFGAAAASDKRLKKNIRKVGEHNGINFYTWEWADKRVAHHVPYGVIAQEIQAIKPEIVSTHPDGYLMVDYARVA